ncbi:NINE protein [Salinicola sp. V024]|uniref:NINE protein n=1 Tax=Salinicola sp. V024 TaxID=3459609 RepID=UPI004044B861
MTSIEAQQQPQPLGANMVYCQGCGKHIHNTAKSCPHCGANSRASGTNRTKWVAAILAFFLGGFGVHRFYLGQAIVGLMYLLFCWTFIPALIAFCEFIYFLVISEDSFDRKYNNQ